MSENDRKKKREEDVRKEREAGKKAQEKEDFDAMELDDENPFCITDRSGAYYFLGKVCSLKFLCRTIDFCTSHAMLLRQIVGRGHNKGMIRAHIYVAVPQYKECIADCIRAEERVPKFIEYAELRARVLYMKGVSYMKLAKCAKDYGLAIEALDLACKFFEFEEGRRRLEDAKRSKEDCEKRECKGDRKRDAGNKLYKENQFAEAMEYYTEAIELNPCDAKAYCNRALCYTLKGMLAEGLKDAERCLELDSNFIRGYVRKGNIEFQKREYSKALETYEMGLEHNKENKELHDAISKCRKEMPPAANKDTIMQSLKGLNEKQAKAMLDPEIQTILSDPIMRQVLIDFQQNSSDAREHAKNELVLQTIQKLWDADLL